MAKLIREKLDESVATLQAVLASRKNTAVRLPSTEKIHAAVAFLGERYQALPECAEVLRALSMRPPVIGARLVDVATLLLERAEVAPGLSRREVEADNKAFYLRSSQYDLEGLINWGLLVGNVIALIYLAADLPHRELGRNQMITWAILCLPVLLMLPWLAKRRSGTSAMQRFWEYRAISGRSDLRYHDWLAGHGHGTDVRPSRRQGFLGWLFFVLVVTIMIVDRAPGR